MQETAQDDLPLSKTKKKQLAKEVEQLAVRLTEMPENQFRKLQLAADVAAEVELARETKGRSSQKRQVKYLAGLLRKRFHAAFPLCELLQDRQTCRCGKCARDKRVFLQQGEFRAD